LNGYETISLIDYAGLLRGAMMKVAIAVSNEQNRKSLTEFLTGRYEIVEDSLDLLIID